MNRYFSFLFFLVVSSTSLQAQSTLWGTTSNSGAYGYGTLYKTDSIGNNLVIVRHFNGVDDGASPGEIIQASNGRIYGMTNSGGHGVVVSSTGPGGPVYTEGGTLFEYDPVIDSFKVLVHFNSTDPQYPLNFHSPSSIRLLEVSPGVLWAVLRIRTNLNSLVSPMNRYVVSYTIGSSSVTSVATVPSWNTSARPSPQYCEISGPLYKAPNGMVYAMATGYSSCALTADISLGSVIRINPANNAFSFIHPFSCSSVDGFYPWQGNLEEVNSDLYGHTYLGGTTAYYPNNGYGVIFKYNPVTNVYTKVYDFPGGSGGGRPDSYMIRANNGKLYGTAGFGTPVNGSTFGTGVLFEFDPATNTYSVPMEYNQNISSGIGLNGKLWLKSSVNGKLYGTTSYGVYEYNTAINYARPAARFANQTSIQAVSLIELCSKPAYKPKYNATYTLCEGSFFSFDLQCQNAQTAIWKRNNVAITSQTTSVLSFSAISQADAGVWHCEMTNACGLTTSKSLTVHVNAAGSGVVTSTLSVSGNTLICPGSSVTLSGNSGGTWNTGVTTAAISVSLPGDYQVINTNACGNTFSNILRIDTLGALPAQLITFTSTSSMPTFIKYFCKGDSAELTGNYNGVWNTGETSPSIFVKDTLLHYVISSNACHVVHSDTVQGKFIPVPQAPVITAVGSTSICAGDSVLLNASGGVTYSWYKTFGNSYSYQQFGNNVYVKNTGDYFVIINHNCGAVFSNTIHIDANTQPVDSAIITAHGSLTICPGSSVTLSSNHPECYWSNGAQTQTITVTQPGSYWVQNSNHCSSKTSAITTVTWFPTPPVLYSEPQTTVCLSTPVFTLAVGSPAGGYYTGPGVTGNTFTPAIAGAGTHSVTYNYYDSASGCTAKASQVLLVDGLPSVVAATSPTFCQGGNVILFQPVSPLGTWNTSQTGGVLIVTQPGTYYVTRTDLCDQSVNSNSVVVVINPLPAVVVTPTSVCSGQNAVLSASGAATYTWTGGISNGVPFQPLVTAVYTVTGTDLNNCKSSVSTTLTVNASPTISVNSGSICAGEQFVMSPSGANSYSYSGNSASVSPLSDQSYTVTGTNADGCVSAEVVSNVSVVPLPTLSVNSGAICSGESFTINPSGAATYVYSGGTNVVSPSTSTTYIVSGTSPEGCIAALNVVSSVTVNPAPVLSVNSGSICQGEQFVILPSGASSYTFSSGSASVSPSASTSYTVTGTDANGCSAIGGVVSSVTVIPLPFITVNSGTLCNGQTFSIIPSGADTYSFEGGSASVSPAVNTSYTVSGVSTEGCASATYAVASVSVYAVPVISVNSGSVCAGRSFTMQPSGAASYTFSSGTGVVTPAASMDYSVSGTSADGCIAAGPGISHVHVHAIPVITASSTSGTMCVGETAEILLTGALSYTWGSGENTAALLVSPAMTTTYTVTGTDINSCEATLSVVQVVSDCVGINETGLNTTSIEVYPNPNHGEFVLRVPEESGVMLLDVLGQVILHKQVEAGTHVVDIQAQANGIYFIQVTRNTSVKRVKIVKE